MDEATPQQHQQHQQQQQQHQQNQRQQHQLLPPQHQSHTNHPPHQEQDSQQHQLHQQPGADVIEATISTLLRVPAATPEDYHEILPKFSSQLKTNFENRNLWLRFGLTIALSKESSHSALQAFHECMRIDQDDPLPAMLAARILLEELNDPEQALKVASEAIGRCKRQLLEKPVNISNGMDSLDNSSIEMICSSVSSLSTSNHSASQITAIQAPNHIEAPETGHETRTTNNNLDQRTQQLPKSAVKGSNTVTNYKGLAPMLARCYVLASVTHAYLYEREPVSIRQLLRESNIKSSLELLESAQETNPQDHLIYFHKALHEAKQRTYPKAIDNLRRAIQINPHHMPSLQLLILSLSALKHYTEALTICESVLREHNDNLMLLYIKCNLEQCLVETKGYKVALGTAQHMLKCVRQQSSTGGSNYLGAHTKNYSSTTTISVAAHSSSQQGQHQSQHNSNTLVSQTNSSSTTAATPSNVAGSTSQVANSLASATHASNQAINVPATLLSTAGDTKQMNNLFAVPNQKNDILADGELSIWIMVAEIFAKIGLVEDAEMCIEEGSVHVSGTLSHHLMYIQGLIAKAKNQLGEAKTFFQSCLALCPKHAKALQQIAHVHYLLGNHSTAEKFLRDSLDLDNDCHLTWYYLSLVYIELNQHNRANDCVKKSATLEETSPSVPFTVIPRLTLQ